MNIDTVEAAKRKAAVAQRFLKSHNISLSNSNALHLIARLEEVDTWQALKSKLEPARRAPTAGVTLLDSGKKVNWCITQNITDRWGDLNYHAWESKVEGHQLLENEVLLEELRSQMFDEITFVAAKDGKLGLLVEIEFACRESEEDADPEYAKKLDDYETVVKSIREDYLPLVQLFPNVQFGVPDASEVINDRPAIWAFFENGALTAEERARLAEEMGNRA